MHVFRSQIHLLLLTLAVAGCSEDRLEMIPIRGEVLYNGEPLTDGMVVYLPKGTGVAQQASGRIQPDGTFELTTSKKGDGVIAGEYNIVVQAYAGPAMLSREQTESGAVASSEPRLIIPKRYIDPVNSGLQDTVDSDHSGFKRLELSD